MQKNALFSTGIGKNNGLEKVNYTNDCQFVSKTGGLHTIYLKKLVA